MKQPHAHDLVELRRVGRNVQGRIVTVSAAPCPGPSLGANFNLHVPLAASPPLEAQAPTHRVAAVDLGAVDGDDGVARLQVGLFGGRAGSTCSTTLLRLPIAVRRG